MKKMKIRSTTWKNAGEAIDQKTAEERFNNPIRVPISIGCYNSAGQWVEAKQAYAWTDADSPGATIYPAASK